MTILARSRGRPAVAARAVEDWLDPPTVSRSAPLAPQIYASIRHAITASRLVPGDGLNELDIAARLGVSRTPVREALLRLQREGLVDIRPQAGTYVAAIDRHRVEEGMVVREALETCAAEEAARRITPAQIADLTAATNQMQTAARIADAAGFVTADDAFHAAILEASGYRGIPTIIDEVNGHLDRIRSMSGERPQRMPEAVAEHRRIIDALQSGDPAASGNALRHHLQTAWKTIRRLCDDHGYK